MTQIGFSRADAHKALDEFLDGDQYNGHRIGRWIAEGEQLESGTVAHIVSDAEYKRISAGYRSWTDAQEVHEDDDLPPGYRPWRHSPLATTDRLLPTEPLHDPLSRIFYGKPYDELPPRRTLEEIKANANPEQGRERARVEIAAISAILRVTLDPDGQGAVPILMVCHEPDEPGPRLRWQLAYVTPVPGLFLRMTGNGFFGEDWAIVTGSGWRLAQGWDEKDNAMAAVEALGRTLPNTDWMRLVPADFTPRAQDAIRAVIRRYRQWGLDEKQPEPEVMADRVPDSDPADAVADADTAAE
ncbi:MAG TPA: hypothetical protein VGG54_23175 [Trebonia sp.]|jgi:hypothetical protein